MDANATASNVAAMPTRARPRLLRPATFAMRAATRRQRTCKPASHDPSPSANSTSQ